ncbi:hypothetical protein Vretimale_289 [Volvox reticuliferus]|uniref:Uncharacterized protein n=1 Tax=Volvox reticuliferus TaxID=1737510 RepID=A0A8J4FHF4_9CHLO|nr:hypothetical protein Vretifemale_2617 [Volvox reticuliferus]GIL94119.1 hypothetical protein Vretimale_289 [Volvox reticuliferus]
MLNLKGDLKASREPNMATAELGEDTCFRVPVLLHPHTEALASLLMPGLGNIREKDTNSAHQLWQQDSRAKDAASRPQQQQTPTLTPIHGNENDAALGMWVSPPALASLREQARHLQQHKHAKGCQQMMDISPGHFELPRGALQRQQQQLTPQNKRLLFDNNRSFTLVGASSTPVRQGSKELTADPATSMSAPMSSALPHQRERDGAVVVPIHLMASLLIKDSVTALSPEAQRRAGAGFGAGSDGYDGTDGCEATQAAAWQSPPCGEILPNGGAAVGAIPEMRGAKQGIHPIQTGAACGLGASGTWTRTADDDGQWQSSALQHVQQPKQQSRQPQERMQDACCPSGSQMPLHSETSEEGYELQQQQRHMPSPAGFQTGAAPSPRGSRWPDFPLGEPGEEKDGKEGDGAMLIDTRLTHRVAEGALLPTPERPRAPNAAGSWDALRGINFGAESPDTNGTGARAAQGLSDGVLGTLALLSPGLRDEGAVGSDVAMAEPLAGSGPGQGRVAEVGSDLWTTEQVKELKPGAGVAPVVQLPKGEDGFDADDEGDGAAGTREDRARAAFRLTGHSVRWRPLPGLEASPPWSPQRAPAAASQHPAAPSLHRHGFASFASLALALPPSTHPVSRNAGQPLLGQGATSSRPPLAHTVTPAASTQATAARGVATLASTATAGVRPVVLPEDWPGRYGAADAEANRESLEEVLKLKCSLRRAVQSQNAQAMVLVLSLLAALPFTPQMLADSQVAALVSPLQFNSNTEVANAARHLTAGWKGVLKAASMRSSLAAQTSTREQTQQQQQLGNHHELEWPQSRRPLRGSLRMISDHITAAGTDAFHHYSHHHQHHRRQQQQQRQMDVHIRDQAGQPHSQLNFPQQQQDCHSPHYRRAAAFGREELPAPHDLGLQSLSLVRCKSEMLTESLVTGATAVARSGSLPDAAAVAVPAPVAAAAVAVSDAAAARTNRGAAAGSTQAGQRPHRAGLQVRLQLAPLQSPQALQVSPGESPIETQGSDQVRHEGDGLQLPRRMPLVVAALGKNTPSESRTVPEADVCSSGEDRPDGARSCPSGCDLVRAGAASADVRGVRFGGSLGIGAFLDSMPSCSPLPTPTTRMVSAPGGGRGSDSAPHSRPLARSAVVAGDITTGQPPLHSAHGLSQAAGGAHVPPAVNISRPGRDASCPQEGVASPTSGMTQPTPPAPHCAISSPAVLPLAAAGVISGSRSAAMRPLPPPSAPGQPTGRKRKVERPASRRRSGNPCKRPASSAKMGQLGPGDPGSVYAGGLPRTALSNAVIGTGGDIASDDKRYHLPAGGLVAGVKTSARSSLLGLHPPSSKRQRYYSGLGNGASPASHGGGAAQVRRVSILLSSLDLGSPGNGVEGDGTETSGEMDATGAAAAAVAVRDLDADVDMGSQDDEAAMLTSDGDLLPVVEPCRGAEGCPSSVEGQELGPSESKGRGALEGGEASLPSIGLLSGSDMNVRNCTNGRHQAAGASDLGPAAPADGCAGGG